MNRPPRILVVDDGRDAADSLCMVLRMFGADSNVVYDGQSALDFIRESKPDIVLLDLSMPGMDGYAVAKQVRTNPECDDVRLIALTGWGTDEERLRSEAGGLHRSLGEARSRCDIAQIGVDGTREKRAIIAARIAQIACFHCDYMNAIRLQVSTDLSHWRASKQ